MKKLLVGIGLFASIFAYTGFSGANVANAQVIDVSQFKQIIELFIALGIIAPEKAEQVRFAFGITAPVVVSTSTPIFQANVESAPVVGGVQSSYDFEPTFDYDVTRGTITISMPNDIESGKVLYSYHYGFVPEGFANHKAGGNYPDGTPLHSGINIMLGGVHKNSYVEWTIVAKSVGTAPTTKNGVFIIPTDPETRTRLDLMQKGSSALRSVLKLQSTKPYTDQINQQEKAAQAEADMYLNQFRTHIPNIDGCDRNQCIQPVANF